jgi:carbonic anhydrase/acetyltransferase-like protein (isoleucine patch superfamily)
MAVYALGDAQPALGENAWIADSAQVMGRIILGKHTSVWFNAVLRGDNEAITIGDYSNVQDGSVLHTDDGVPLTIDQYVTVGHMAMLHGCTIGEGSLIGMNAAILNHAVIGKHCLIGAKTLIPEGKVIPDRSLVVGTPGRIIRELTDEEIARIHAGCMSYVSNAERFARELKLIRP